MANAPNGAVSTIARTATVSTRSPQVKPNASGIPPIAAWTVAFGVYASIVNSLSFLLRLVPNRHTNTPNILNTNAHALAVDEPMEYARLVLDGEMQAWIDAEDSLEVW